MSSAESTITTPGDIPTLSDLYAQDAIPPPEIPPAYPYDEALNKKISIWRGDITLLKVNMIVNAANKSLLGGGGVDGAIHRAAGEELLDECETLGGADTGETKLTQGYRLPAKYIAHTVGPVYSRSRVEQCERQLESCYASSLRLCSHHGGGSIGLCSISTGVYGYPLQDATEIALETTRRYLETQGDKISRVIFVVFSARDEKCYRSTVPYFFPGKDEPTATAKDEDKELEVENSALSEQRPLQA
ncbi:hypothetical protein P7C73_g5560, partial [Tremellales sp. Uapishka_1]